MSGLQEPEQPSTSDCCHYQETADRWRSDHERRSRSQERTHDADHKKGRAAAGRSLGGSPRARGWRRRRRLRFKGRHPCGVIGKACVQLRDVCLSVDYCSGNHRVARRVLR